MATRDAKKKRLSFKDHKRLLTYSSTAGRDELIERVYEVFQDVISTGTNIFLQTKDQEWDGVYLGLLDQESWIRVCLRDDTPNAASEPLATFEARCSDQVRM